MLVMLAKGQHPLHAQSPHSLLQFRCYAAIDSHSLFLTRTILPLTAAALFSWPTTVWKFQGPNISWEELFAVHDRAKIILFDLFSNPANTVFIIVHPWCRQSQEVFSSPQMRLCSYTTVVYLCLSLWATTDISAAAVQSDCGQCKC